MNAEQIKNEALINKRDCLREGQQLFNYIQTTYKIGYLIKEKYDIDCFYDDSKIKPFLEKVIEELESTKIVCISDLHGYLPTNLPEGNILVICGDIAPLIIDKDILKSTVWWSTKFIPWIKTLNFEMIIFIAGNHDFLPEFIKNGTFLDIIDPDYTCVNLTYLENESYSYRGIEFYGSPNIQYLTNWAFYKSDSELKETFEKIPSSTDFLITHQPPKLGSCGVIMEYSTYKKDCGNPALTQVLSHIPNIKYSVFGHIHSGDHNCTSNENGTKCYNVSLLDESYNLKYEPLVIEYGKEIFKK